MMSLESALHGAEGKFENEKKSEGMELERSGPTGLL